MGGMMGGIDGERVDIGDIVIMFVCSYDKKSLTGTAEYKYMKTSLISQRCPGYS